MLDASSVFPIPHLVLMSPSSIKNPRSLPDTKPTKIMFVNLLQTKVSILWVDFDGKRKFYRSLDPGSSYWQPTFVDHIWEVVADDCNKKPVAFFKAIPYDGLAEILDTPITYLTPMSPSSVKDPRSLPDTKPTKITFVNLRQTKVTILWVDFDGKRKFYRSLDPGSSYSQPTFVDHIWEVVTDDCEKKSVAFFKAVPYDGLAEIQDTLITYLTPMSPSSIKDPRSLPDSKPTKITFLNLLQTKVTILWVDFDGKRKFYRSLDPGSSYSQPTFVDHIWEVVTDDCEKKPVVFFKAMPYEGLAEIDDRFL
ncbi:hypothetical protein C0993_011699 [Termitomyces sp. T159_Od127]|nr:hypothetical protein C0993_011699 [Termitomyces sp. T159_Od127]